jgi:predicted membrane chloride channel (bestrophin family)
MSNADFKAFWKSKTLWGVLITMIPTLLRVSGVPLPPGVDEAIVEVLIVATGATVATRGRIEANPNLTLR